MSAMEGFGNSNNKKTGVESVRDTARKALNVLTVVGSLSAGAGMAQAQAGETINPFDATTITLSSLADNKAKDQAKYEVLKSLYVSRRVTLNVALLAHATAPNYASLQSDENLAFASQVDPVLVLPLVTHHTVSAEYWDNLSHELNDSIPALTHVESSTTQEVKIDILKDLSARYGGVDPIELEESVAYVARNLAVILEKPTDANVQAEVKRILERRAEVGAQDVWRHNVLLVSGDEILTKETHHEGEVRFGKQALQNEIITRQQSSPVPLTFTNVDPFVSDTAPYHSTPESIAQAKADTLKTIETSTDPLTVFLDGHGNPDVWGLSGQLDQKTGLIISGPEDVISVSELAHALELRYQAELELNHNSLRLSIVSSACYMQDFQRNLAEMLSARHIPLPDLMISASEYGEPGFSDWDNRFGARFNELIATSPDLKAFMEHKHDVKVSDPSVFVPRKDDPTKIMQIGGIVAPPDYQIG